MTDIQTAVTPNIPLPDDEIAVALDISTVKTGWFAAVGDTFSGGRLIKADGWYAMSIAIINSLEVARPMWVAIEGTWLGKNTKTFEELVGLRYCVLKWLTDQQICYYVGQPASIDAACGIRTFLPRVARKRATKALAHSMGWDVPEDVADALAVLVWGCGERRKDAWLQANDGQ